MKQKSSFFKALGIMLLSVLFATQANAQELTVSGTVNDDFGPIIGASVLVKGTSNGSITDMNGEFTLSGVPAKGTLVISFIGYQTQEIQVNNQQKLSINLKEDSQQLQEVVVMAMGYGDVRCKHLTGSIVKADIKLFGDIPKKIKCKRVHFILNKYMTCSIKHLISVITLTDSYFILIKVSNTNTSDIGKGLKSII